MADELHVRAILIAAVVDRLNKSGILVIEDPDVVKVEDLPCVVIEEVQETVRPFDDSLARRATTIERRIRFAVISFGKDRAQRDEMALEAEKVIVPAAVGAGFSRISIVGAGFVRTKVGTEGKAFVASTFYECVYATPTYQP